jgi:hypothetical protein
MPSGATCRWWWARTCATGCAARSSAARPPTPRSSCAATSGIFPSATARTASSKCAASSATPTCATPTPGPKSRTSTASCCFPGQRMLITGKSGRSSASSCATCAPKSPTSNRHDELLTVSGKAAGATADFLRFIEASPVGERIDHFTEDMRAEGQRRTRPQAGLPLRNMAQLENRRQLSLRRQPPDVDSDLPPLTEVRGALRFSGDHLEARGIRGNLLAMPLKRRYPHRRRQCPGQCQRRGQRRRPAAGQFAASAVRPSDRQRQSGPAACACARRRRR